MKRMNNKLVLKDGESPDNEDVCFTCNVLFGDFDMDAIETSTPSYDLILITALSELLIVEAYQPELLYKVWVDGHWETYYDEREIEKFKKIGE